MAAIFSRKRDVIRLLPALAQSYSLFTAAGENINLKPCGYASSYTCLQLNLNAEFNLKLALAPFRISPASKTIPFRCLMYTTITVRDATEL